MYNVHTVHVTKHVEEKCDSRVVAVKLHFFFTNSLSVVYGEYQSSLSSFERRNELKTHKFMSSVFDIYFFSGKAMTKSAFFW